MDRRHAVLGLAVVATLADSDRASDSGPDWYEWASLTAEGPPVLLSDDARKVVGVTVHATLPSASSSADSTASFTVTTDDPSLGSGVVSLTRVACTSGDVLSESTTPELVLGDFLDLCDEPTCSHTFCVAIERNGYPYEVALHTSASATIESDAPLDDAGTVSLTIDFDD